jgi:hypothetical protein
MTTHLPRRRPALTTTVFSRFAGLMVVGLMLVGMGLVGPGVAVAQRPVDVPPPPADAEGLQRKPSSNVDEFQVRPGADFSIYKRLLLAPVDVSFARYWARQHRDVDAKESLRIRTELATLAREEFTRQLQRAGGYPVVNAPGPDVLEVRASIVNLDVHAPDVDKSSINRSYVLSAGEGTLIAELRDSQTGTLLARVVDRRETREYPEFVIANRVTNSAEARDLVGTWSRLLRRYLDTARNESK